MTQDYDKTWDVFQTYFVHFLRNSLLQNYYKKIQVLLTLTKEEIWHFENVESVDKVCKDRISYLLPSGGDIFN